MIFVCSSYIEASNENKKTLRVISRSHCLFKCFDRDFTKWVCLHEACRDKITAHLYSGSGSSSQHTRRTAFSQLFRASTMDTKPQRSKHQDIALSSLNAAIEALNLAKELSGVTPAKAVFGTAGVILTMIRVSFP